MEARVTQDELGTHIEWEHDGVTARMIDWFWSNMEKGMLLWHPNQHEPLEWYLPPKHGDLVGSVHIAPQTWSDGTRQNLYIKMEPLEALSDTITDLIIYNHCYVAGGYDEATIDEGRAFGYRLHQWQATDAGVVGKSSALSGTKKETHEQGLVWADHCVARRSATGGSSCLSCISSIRSSPILSTIHSPDLSVERRDGVVRYLYMP